MEHFLLEHPIAKVLISELRDHQTPIDEFRKATAKLTTLLLLEATRKLAIESRKVDTPLEACDGYNLKHQPVFLPILRSGLSMLPSALKLFPQSVVGMIGMVRNEETAVAMPYYYNVPNLHRKTVFILEPMLATGGTCKQVLDKVYRTDPLHVYLLSFVAAPEGLQVLKVFDNLSIHLVSCDRTLNSQKYILPGLGDFGDRYFGTV